MATTFYMFTRMFNLQRRTAELAWFLFPAGLPLKSRGWLNPWWLANENNLTGNDTHNPQSTLRWQMMTFPVIPSHPKSDMPALKAWLRKFLLLQEWLPWGQLWCCCPQLPVLPHSMDESPPHVIVTGLLPPLL